LKNETRQVQYTGIKNSVPFNVAVIIGICIVLYFTFFAFLGLITGHGEAVRVPNVIGKSMTAGLGQLHKIGFDVQIDSAYDPEKKPFTILGQQPNVGESVKPGRTIFLTVNKAEPPQTPMPNLTGLSLRSAIMILKSAKLSVGDTSYRPDIAQGAILEQLYEGKVIRPGQMIPQGSSIDLVIGDGLGNTEFDVPDIVGLPYVEAVAMLSGYNLHFTAIASGEISDTETAIIYMQVPTSMNELGRSNRLREGDELGFYYKQDPLPEEMQHNPTPVNSVDSATKTRR
jgi:beta-lactam-binding protein with PASTA domain